MARMAYQHQRVTVEGEMAAGRRRRKSASDEDARREKGMAGG